MKAKTKTLKYFINAHNQTAGQIVHYEKRLQWHKAGLIVLGVVCGAFMYQNSDMYEDLQYQKRCAESSRRTVEELKEKIENMKKRR